jgi:hypothetical protein
MDTLTHLLVPPDSPDNGDERLVHIDPLLRRGLDALGVEPFGKVPALYKSLSAASCCISRRPALH